MKNTQEHDAQFLDLEPGTSWACRFRTVDWLDAQGVPTRAHPSVGQAHPGVPGEYSSIGIIRTRDVDSRLLELEDTQPPHRTYVVSWDNCWAVDTIEWITDGQETQTQ